MRRGEHIARAFQAPVDVHASADGQVYMFRRLQNESAAASSDEDEEEEELTVMEMRPRVFREQEQDGLRNIQLLEREVSDGDNLNKLALQYGCKVADIKRLNNLMQEQDLFGLKSIKIPVQKHSFLTEANTDLCEARAEMPHSSNTPERPQDRARGRAQPHLQEVTDFLMEVDQDIEKLIQTTNDQDEDSLENSEERFGLKGRSLTSHGADWGIQWWNAVVAMLLIGIVLPLFYVIYFKTRDNVADGTAATQAAVNSTNTSGLGPATSSGG